jgi:NADH:ubiquinone oxidoreductase subunit 5 (subunit L)/multisubunit Na+/H+ antiporter MnhA subunit
VPAPLVIVKVAVPLWLSATLQFPAAVNATVKLELAEAATPNVPLYGSLEGAVVVNVIVWLAGLTVWLTDPELPAWLLSPEYVADTVFDPPPRLLVVHVATPG